MGMCLDDATIGRMSQQQQTPPPRRPAPGTGRRQLRLGLAGVGLVGLSWFAGYGVAREHPKTVTGVQVQYRTPEACTQALGTAKKGLLLAGQGAQAIRESYEGILADDTQRVETATQRVRDLTTSLQSVQSDLRRFEAACDNAAQS